MSDAIFPTRQGPKLVPRIYLLMAGLKNKCFNSSGVVRHSQLTDLAKKKQLW